MDNYPAVIIQQAPQSEKCVEFPWLARLGTLTLPSYDIGRATVSIPASGTASGTVQYQLVPSSWATGPTEVSETIINIVSQKNC